MSDDLKPCPFCGGTKSIICRTDYDGGDAYAVSCRYSDCHGHIFTLGHGYFSTKEQAIAAWNTRADADRIEQLERENARLGAGWSDANFRALDAGLKLAKAVEALRLADKVNLMPPIVAKTIHAVLAELEGKE